MRSSTSAVLLLVALNLTLLGCGKKKAGGGDTSAGGGAPATLKAFLASAPYQQLLALATETRTLAASKDCDAVNARGKQAITLLLELVPDYGAIGDAAGKDEKLADRMGDLNAIRATLQMSTRGYDDDTVEHGSDAGSGAGMDMREHYCKAIAEDLATVKP